MFVWFKKRIVQKCKLKLTKDCRSAVKKEKRLELMRLSSWDINTK